MLKKNKNIFKGLYGWTCFRLQVSFLWLLFYDMAQLIIFRELKFLSSTKHNCRAEQTRGTHLIGLI